MRLDEACVKVFARHETFHPRYGWLKKAVDAAAAPGDIFNSPDAVVELGVGKNMVKSIRHWGLAFKVLEPDPGSSSRRPVLQPSRLGEAWFGTNGVDPYMELPGTHWFLHWQLLAPRSQAPVWWTAFNEFPAVEFTEEQLLRNTRQIHESFGPLAPTRMTSRGGDGVDVTFIPAGDDALGAADDAVDILLEAGWAPGNIALLTTGHRHNVQIELAESRGQVGYWRTYWDDDVFYGHVLGCKGLERPAVVLCVNESEARDRSREKLYVGMSRATDQLIVVGDPDHVREIGGTDVARRLGILEAAR